MKKRSECNCECHHYPDSVKHFMACCHDDEDILFSIPMKEALPNKINLVGQTEENAKKLLEAAGMQYRIMRKDGESFMGTMDFNPDRFNLVVEQGIITEVTMN